MNPLRELKKVALELRAMKKQAGPPAAITKWKSNEWKEWKARSRFQFDTPEEKAQYMKDHGCCKEEAIPCIEENFPGMTPTEKEKIEKIFKKEKA